MGKPQLVWSPIQLQLENHARVSPIGKSTTPTHQSGGIEDLHRPQIY